MMYGVVFILGAWTGAVGIFLIMAIFQGSACLGATTGNRVLGGGSAENGGFEAWISEQKDGKSDYDRRQSEGGGLEVGRDARGR